MSEIRILLEQIEQRRTAASILVAKMLDIRAKINSDCIEKDELNQVKAHIAESDSLANFYWDQSDRSDEILRRDDQSNLDRWALRKDLGKLRELTAKLRTECMNVLEDIYRMECRKLNRIGMKSVTASQSS